mgnify:CR=1 FL=1
MSVVPACSLARRSAAVGGRCADCDTSIALLVVSSVATVAVSGKVTLEGVKPTVNTAACSGSVALVQLRSREGDVFDLFDGFSSFAGTFENVIFSVDGYAGLFDPAAAAEEAVGNAVEQPRPDHLDRHPTVESYAAAKARVFQRQQPEDWAVVNADDPAWRRLLPASRLVRYTVAGAPDAGP